MLAPCQISSRVVRVPKTASHSPTKASSLWMSLGQEGAVGFGEDDEVAFRLHQAPPAGVAVPLAVLEDHPGLGLLDLLDRAGLGVVVDDEDLVDHAGVVEALDHRADRIALGVGHQHDRDAPVTPHPDGAPIAGHRFASRWRLGDPRRPTVTDMITLLEGLATTRAIRRYTDDPDPRGRPGHDPVARHPGAIGVEPPAVPVRGAARQRRSRGRRRPCSAGPSGRTGAAKQRADGYEAGSGTDDRSPKARMARTMQHFVDHFEATPVVVLPCHVRYRNPNPYEGASVYPACQNLLLAARALGYGGVMTIWHAFVEAELRRSSASPTTWSSPPRSRSASRWAPRAGAAPPDRGARVRGPLGRPGGVGRRSRRHPVHRRPARRAGLTGGQAGGGRASARPAGAGSAGVVGDRSRRLAGAGRRRTARCAGRGPGRGRPGRDDEQPADHLIDAVVPDLVSELALTSPMPSRMASMLPSPSVSSSRQSSKSSSVSVTSWQNSSLASVRLAEEVDDARRDVGQADPDPVEGVAVTQVGGDRVHAPDGADRADGDERDAHRAHHVQVHGTDPRRSLHVSPPARRRTRLTAFGPPGSAVRSGGRWRPAPSCR